MKTFKYKNYGDCYFEVNNYFHNKKSMAISIKSINGERITVATVNMVNYIYEPNTATIKNYSENTGITDFLENLDFIIDIYSRKKCNPYAAENETIDYCLIDIDRLKEYSKEFNYKWDF